MVTAQEKDIHTVIYLQWGTVAMMFERCFKNVYENKNITSFSKEIYKTSWY